MARKYPTPSAPQVGAVERSWISYRDDVMPKNAPAVQIHECRLAFYAGAVALFGEITNKLDPGDEPTARDLARVDAIANELREFKP